MTGTYAPTNRARRILIAVLAFALVAGLAIATSIAPAGADDPKEFKLFVDEIVDDIRRFKVEDANKSTHLRWALVVAVVALIFLYRLATS